MDFLTVFGRMSILFVMMAAGYIVYKIGWIDDSFSGKLSKLVVSLFNPCLVINGVLSSKELPDKSLIFQNIRMVIIFYVIVIAAGILLSKALGAKGSVYTEYALMFTFSNVGFLGIPVISSILGDRSIIYITFYILGFNVLFYTYGIFMVQRNIPREERKSGIAGLLNPGVVAAVLAIVIYAAGIDLPDPVDSFFDYMGNATIPLSMIAIGITMAMMPVKKIFLGVRVYAFSALKLLVMPIVCALLMKRMASDTMVFSVFVLMLSMPVGSMVAMLSGQYFEDCSESSRGVVLTTLLCMVTVPVVCLFL